MNRLRIVLIVSTLLSAYAWAEAPLIGITMDFVAEDDSIGSAIVQMSYVEAVYEAGGLPVLLPPLRQSCSVDDYLNRLDGLLLIGGADVWPGAYGEKPHPTVDSLNERRFRHETRLIRAWLERTRKPILGVCLGCQLTNVVCGGTLVQDIHSLVGEKVQHRGPGGTYHTVTLARDSRLYRLFAVDTLSVLSNHHQAVSRVGRGLRIAAIAPDGVIEALELEGERFGLFVQWHPERMASVHRRTLFSAFVSSCRQSNPNMK